MSLAQIQPVFLSSSIFAEKNCRIRECFSYNIVLTQQELEKAN